MDDYESGWEAAWGREKEAREATYAKLECANLELAKAGAPLKAGSGYPFRSELDSLKRALVYARRELPVPAQDKDWYGTGNPVPDDYEWGK